MENYAQAPAWHKRDHQKDQFDHLWLIYHLHVCYSIRDINFIMTPVSEGQDGLFRYNLQIVQNNVV